MMLSTLLKDFEHRLDGSDVEIRAITSDSRVVAPGTFFVAIPGTRLDGHRFVASAVEQGAVAVMVERALDVPVPRVQVEDSRRAFALAARRFYGAPDDAMTVVGVTGTNGKTTVATLLGGVLAAAGKDTAVLGTLGLRRGGVRLETGLTTPGPLELARMLRELVDDGTDALAMEVSSHALHQHRVAGVSFDAAVFTNLSRDHLDYHDTMEAYFEAKAMLFRERRKAGGVSVLNIDDAYGRRLVDPESWTYGLAADARVTMDEVEHDIDGIRATIRCAGENFEVRSPLVGEFNVSNVLAAVATGLALGISSESVATGIAHVNAVPGRLERVSEPGQPLVFVDYAHTPDALEKALAVLRPLTPGRVLCVMGCGGDRDAGKRPAMGAAAAQGASFTYVTNDNPRSEDPMLIARAVERGLGNAGGRRGENYDVILDRASAIEAAIRAASREDVVLIAGKGHEDYQIVGDERRHFDDREVARGVLSALGG